jgi:hypothetical protein
MKPEIRQKLARESFEEKIRKLGQLIRLSHKIKTENVFEEASIDKAAAAMMPATRSPRTRPRKRS